MNEPLPTYTRRDQTRPDWAHNYSRPNDVPPSYADSVRWFFYNSLRPAFLVASLVSAIGAAILCGVQWRSMGETSGKAHIFSLVSAVLFTVVAVFQFYAFMAGLNSHISMLRSAHTDGRLVTGANPQSAVAVTGAAVKAFDAL